MLWKGEDEEAAVPGLARHSLATTSGWSAFFSSKCPCEFFREGSEKKWPGRHVGVTNALGTRCEGSSFFKIERVKKNDAEG